MKAIIKLGIKNGTAYQTQGGSTVTTADVGIWHEKGTKFTEKRSWLFEPIEDFMEMNPYNPFEEEVEEYAERMKEYVIEGFSTNGHGKWEGSKAAAPYRKKNGEMVNPGDGINLHDLGVLVNDIEVWVEWI